MKILISGRPGVGKTTLILRIVEYLKLKNITFCGFITPEIRKNGYRIGFKVVDLCTGRKFILATTEKISNHKIGKYYVDVDTFCYYVDELKRKISDYDVILVDEIGKMEFMCDKFQKFILNILRSDKIFIGTVHRHLVDKFKDKVEVIWLNEENRRFILEEIKMKIDKFLSSS